MESNSLLDGSGGIMYYPRQIGPAIQRMAKRKPIIVLTGARQVGKSTMLKEVYRGSEPHRLIFTN